MAHEPATFLPEDIREVLRRKSSRDPSSRFPAKLHLLLTYTSELPHFQEMVGLAWVTDEEFKMNKTVLAGVMGIKVNTLNVNLRDLRYEQLQRDKDGWTRWKRSGFTRTANGIDADPEPAARAPEPGLIGRSPTVPFALGHLSGAQKDRFLNDTQRLWTDLLHLSPTSVALVDVMIDRAAERFRYHEQPLENAHDVISAILKPTVDTPELSFADFGRFLAMFGPEKTIMLKIASLLTCSNTTGRWLVFDRAQIGGKAPLAWFSQEMPNCLIVKHIDDHQEKVFNIPVADALTGAYLVDDAGRSYKNWDDWFAKHPVRYAQGFRA